MYSMWIRGCSEVWKLYIPISCWVSKLFIKLIFSFEKELISHFCLKSKILRIQSFEVKSTTDIFGTQRFFNWSTEIGKPSLCDRYFTIRNSKQRWASWEKKWQLRRIVFFLFRCKLHSIWEQYDLRFWRRRF